MARSICTTCGSEWFEIKFKERSRSVHTLVVRCSQCGGIMECESTASLPHKGKIRLAKPLKASKTPLGWQPPNQAPGVSVRPGLLEGS
jgi:uncharacterized Zn finger protein